MRGFNAIKIILFSILLLLAFSTTGAENPNSEFPAKPTPNFSWDTVPVSFHGANKARMYTEQEAKQASTNSLFFCLINTTIPSPFCIFVM